MPLRTEKLFIDLYARNDNRLVASLEDPTRLDPAALWFQGDKLAVEIYPCEVRGQDVLPVDLPAGYTCTLSAVRADDLNQTQLLSQALTITTEQAGHKSFTGILDLTPADIATNLAIPDANYAPGIRLRVQVKITSPDSSEILRPTFIALLRPNIDPPA